MDSVKLAEHLLKNIRKRQDELTQSLADGSIDSIEDYRFITEELRS